MTTRQKLLERIEELRIDFPGRWSDYLTRDETELLLAILPGGDGVTEGKAHKTMTREEYAAMTIIGWHMVCRDYDGFGGVGMRFIADGILPSDDGVTEDKIK